MALETLGWREPSWSLVLDHGEYVRLSSCSGGGQHVVVLYTLIQTARLNDVDPQAWLADVLARIANHPIRQLDERLPRNCRPPGDPPPCDSRVPGHCRDRVVGAEACLLTLMALGAE